MKESTDELQSKSHIQLNTFHEETLHKLQEKSLDELKGHTLGGIHEGTPGRIPGQIRTLERNLFQTP